MCVVCASSNKSSSRCQDNLEMYSRVQRTNIKKVLWFLGSMVLWLSRFLGSLFPSSFFFYFKNKREQ